MVWDLYSFGIQKDFSDYLFFLMNNHKKIFLLQIENDRKVFLIYNFFVNHYPTIINI